MKACVILDPDAAMIQVSSDFTALLRPLDGNIRLAEVPCTHFEFVQHRLVHGVAGCHQKAALRTIATIDFQGLNRLCDRAESLHEFTIDPHGVVEAIRGHDLTEGMLQRAPDVTGVAGTGAIARLSCIEHYHRAPCTSEVDSGHEPGNA